MNSLVCVDKNEQRSRFSVLGDREEDPRNGGNTSTSSTGGSVILVLPNENVVRGVDSSDECIPIMVDNVPVYLSQTDNRSPLYIRQYPPSVEELLLDESSKPSPTFDGFSEASGSTFDGFSEASYCSNVTFEGFDENQEDADTVDKVNVSVPGDSVEEVSGELSPDKVPLNTNDSSDEGKTVSLSSGNNTSKQTFKKLVNREELPSKRVKVNGSGDSEIVSSDPEGSSSEVKNNLTPPTGRVKTRSFSCDSVSISSDHKVASKKLDGKKLLPFPRRVTRRSSSFDSKGKNFDLEDSNEPSATLKRQNSSEEIVSSKKLKPEETHENTCKTSRSETQKVLHVEPQEIKADNVSSRRTRRSVDSENDSSSTGMSTRKTRGRRGTTEEDNKEIPVEEVIPDNSQDFIGKLCSSVGCTISFLESMKIKNVTVCNGIVYELSEFAKKIAWERIDVAMWIQRLSGVKDGKPTAEDLDKIHIVLKRRKALNVTLAGQKIGDMKLKAFDLTEFVLPSSIKNEVEEDMQPVSNLQEEDHELQKNIGSEKKMESVKDVRKKQRGTKNRRGSGKDVKTCDRKEIKFKFMFKKRSENKTEQYREELESQVTTSTVGDFDLAKEAQNECREEYLMNMQIQETKCIESAVVVNKENYLESLLKTDGIESPHITSNSNVGTLGVSKSGRLRKPSARGIQSIEIKSLFMQNSASSTQPTQSGTSQENVDEKLNSRSDLDVYHKPDSHEEHRLKRSRYPKDPDKLYKGMYLNRYKRLLQNDNSVISFTFKEGHLVPRFKEVDYYLGDYCCEAGVTVEDINSEEKKDVDMTVGMVKELHDFYVSRGASKTSLALRLMQMGSVKVLDYTQVLSTVLSISKAAKTSRLDFNQLQREFKFPRRQFYSSYKHKKKKDKSKEKGHIIQNSYLSVSTKKKRALFQVPEEFKSAAIAEIKKRRGRPKKMITQSQVTDYELALDVEIVRASLKLSAWNAADKKFRISPPRKKVKRLQAGTHVKDVNFTHNEMVRTGMKEGSENTGIVKRKVGRPRKNIIQTPMSSRTVDMNSVPGSETMMTREKEGTLKRKELGVEGRGEKKRVGRPRKKIQQVPASSHAEDMNFAFDNEIVRTRGREGSITRGDIVYLYTQWLRNKMAVGSNVFVTDLLKDVEQLMADRKVQSIRIPAGTLMSSSVRLHDEYKQMLTVSKEDAMLYLEEDWLEDIQYLVSISRPSRRSTMEGDNGGNSLEKTDVEESFTHQEKFSDSDYSEKSLVIDDSVMSDDSSTVGENAKVLDKRSLELDDSKCDVNVTEKRLSVGKIAPHPDPRSRLRVTREASGNNRKEMLKNHMESVGKRSNKKRLGISHSLEEYDLEDFTEVQTEECPQKQEGKYVTRSNRNASHNTEVKADRIYTEEDYDVEKIVDYQEVYNKKRGKHLKYLVRWLGFGAEEDCWVDEADLECPEILDEFWKTARRKKWRNSIKKNPLRNNLQNHELPEVLENFQTKDSTASALEGSDKENSGNIIEAMTQHASLERCSKSKPSKEAEGSVTRREVLDLYDNWRQENQNVLMAGGSNTVNLEILVSRATDLMTSRKIKHFHPDSLLNACFMMTLMRARLKTEKALRIFLDSNCSEVLETSHKQYLTTQCKYNIGEKRGKKDFTSKGITISSLQNDFQRMQCELSAAMGFRSANRCVLGVLEEEVDCLEHILKGSQESNSDIGILLRQKVEILKEDLNSLENKNGKGSNSTASNVKKSWKAKKGSRLKLPICLTEYGSDKLREPVLQAGQELLKYGVPSQKIDRMIELVVNKISGQRLRAWPAGVRSIAEEVGLVHI